MKFRTEITIKGVPGLLSPERLILLAGSCFSDNIGGRMQGVGWPCIFNPCGTLYNPVSIAILFRLALSHRTMRRAIVAESITSREGRYVSWFMGSKAMGDTPEECVDKVCEALDSLERGIEAAEAVVLTFGTSDVWLIAGTDRAVGNCHKHPSSEFEKKRIGIDETVSLWKETIACVRQRNEKLKVILTVSPRRYMADGFEENSRQKAVLVLACERLCRETEGVLYFPSYEIMNDDLRDYRFYGKDMLHPSDSAVDYIWEKFTQAYLDEDGMRLLRQMEKETARRRHIPLAK